MKSYPARWDRFNSSARAAPLSKIPPRPPIRHARIPHPPRRPLLMRIPLPRPLQPSSNLLEQSFHHGKPPNFVIPNPARSGQNPKACHSEPDWPFIGVRNSSPSRALRAMNSLPSHVLRAMKPAFLFDSPMPRTIAACQHPVNVDQYCVFDTGSRSQGWGPRPQTNSSWLIGVKVQVRSTVGQTLGSEPFLSARRARPAPQRLSHLFLSPEVHEGRGSPMRLEEYFR